MALEDVRRLCVDTFKLSKTREGIMNGLETVVTKLRDANVKGLLWLDGSFVTEKIDPCDVDMVLEIARQDYDVLAPNEQQAVIWFSHNLKAAHKCDSFVFFTYPEGHELFWTGRQWWSEWHYQFGLARRNHKKGIIVLELRGAL